MCRVNRRDHRQNCDVNSVRRRTVIPSELGRIVSNEWKETQQDQSDDGQTKSFLEFVGRGLNDVSA